MGGERLLRERRRDDRGKRRFPLALVALISFAAIGCEAEEKSFPRCYQFHPLPCSCAQGQDGILKCLADGSGFICICSSLRDGEGDGGYDSDSGDGSKPSLCGNGVVDLFSLESCDGDDLDGRSCFSLGRGSGTLACDPFNCKFDLSGCTSTFDAGDTEYYDMPGPFIEVLPDGGSLTEIETISDWGCPPWEEYTSSLSQGQWPETLPQCLVHVSLPIRLVAADLGDGYRFLKIAAAAVLGEQATAAGVEPVLLKYSHGYYGGDWSMVMLENRIDAFTLAAIDIASIDLGSPAYFYSGSTLLLCGQFDCRLYEDSEPDATGIRYSLVPIANSVLPLEPPAVRGLGQVPMFPDCDSQLGAFGDGILCFNGLEWITVVAAGSGAFFNAISSSLNYGIAVGDGGRVTELQADGSWSDLDSGTEVDLHTVVFDGQSFIAAGDGGVIVVGDLAGARSCAPSSWNIVHFDDFLGYRCLFEGVTERGEIFTGQRGCDLEHPDSESWCYRSLPGPVLDASNWPCGIGLNLWVLTADVLYGETFCAVD